MANLALKYFWSNCPISRDIQLQKLAKVTGHSK